MALVLFFQTITYDITYIIKKLEPFFAFENIFLIYIKNSLHVEVSF